MISNEIIKLDNNYRQMLYKSEHLFPGRLSTGQYPLRQGTGDLDPPRTNTIGAWMLDPNIPGHIIDGQNFNMFYLMSELFQSNVTLNNVFNAISNRLNFAGPSFFRTHRSQPDPIAIGNYGGGFSNSGENIIDGGTWRLLVPIQNDPNFPIKGPEQVYDIDTFLTIEKWDNLGNPVRNVIRLNNFINSTMDDDYFANNQLQTFITTESPGCGIYMKYFNEVRLLNINQINLNEDHPTFNMILKNIQSYLNKSGGFVDFNRDIKITLNCVILYKEVEELIYDYSMTDRFGIRDGIWGRHWAEV